MDTGLETLTFDFPGHGRAAPFAPLVIGVVGSGNLEVLVEPAAHDRCRVVVETSARGFGPIWRAVLEAFAERHPEGGIDIAIHDMGATPAVVSLRLDQAASERMAQAGTVR